MTNLPRNRQLKKLWEIAYVFAWSSAPQGDVFFENGSVPFIRTFDLGQVRDSVYLTVVKDKINQKCIDSHNLVKVKRGTIIFPKSWASILTNKKAILGIDWFLVSHLAWVDADNIITNKYLFYFFLTINIANLSENEAYPSLKLSQIKEIQIPLPPLATQQKIVEKLDEVSAVIKENQEKIRGQIAALDELWESKLDEVFSNEEWKVVKLEEVSEFGPKKAEVKNLDQETLVSFVPMADLNEHQIDFTVNEVRKLKEVYSGYTYFAENDVLLAKVTPCFENGKSWIAKNLENGIGFGSSEYFVYRPKEKLILSEWIYYCISSRQFIEEWKNNMSWAVWLQRVTKEYAKEYQLPLPPLSTQKAIVEELDELQKVITELKTHYTTQLEQYDELRNSLLAQAFKGELVK